MSTKKPNILYQYIDKFKTSYHTYLEIVGSFLWIPVPCEIYNKKIDGLILKCLRVQSEHANHWIIQSIKTRQDSLFCKLSESQDKPWVGIVRKGGSVQQQLDHFLEGFLYTCFCQVWFELLHGICIISIGRNVCSPVYRFLLENQKPLWHHDRATASIK